MPLKIISSASCTLQICTFNLITRLIMPTYKKVLQINYLDPDSYSAIFMQLMYCIVVLR